MLVNGGLCMEANRQSVIDFNRLEECCSGDLELERELINMFFRTGNDSIRKLEVNIREGDAEAIISEAHKLKGSCRALGADSLARVCETIEITARDGFVESLSPFVELARVKFAALRETLGDRMNNTDMRAA